MALRRWTCTECNKEFQAGDWWCFPGQAHVVPVKTYYMDDAPHDKRDCKNSRLVMANLIPETRYTVGDVIHSIPGRDVCFIRGQYATADPHEQMRLDERKTVSYERWAEVYFSDSEKMEIEKRAVAAERQRIENERNQLLAEVKKLKKFKPEFAAKEEHGAV